MSSPDCPSIFDELRPPERYGWKGISAIIYILSIQLAVLLFGMACLANWITTDGSSSNIPAHTTLAPVVSAYLILAPVLGTILRGRTGWMLAVSCCYTVFGFSLLFLRTGHYIATSIGCCMAAIALASMLTYDLKRFYKVAAGQSLPVRHFYSFLIGILVTILLPAALG